MEKTVEEYIELVRQGGDALKEVPEEVQISHPEICIEALKYNPWALEYVSKNVKWGLNNMYELAMIIARVEPESVLTLLKNFEEDKEKALSICIEAIKYNLSSIEDLPKELLEEFPEIECFYNVKKNKIRNIDEIPEEILEKYPELKYIYEISKNPDRIFELSEEELQQYPELYVVMLDYCNFSEYSNYFSRIPQKLCNINPSSYIAICQKYIKEYMYDDGYNAYEDISLDLISKDVLLMCPQLCFNAIRKYAYNLEYVPKEIQEKYPEKYIEMCLEAVKKNGRALEFVAKEVLEKDLDKYVEVCKEAVKQNGHALVDVAKEVLEKDLDKYVEVCKEAVKQNGYALVDVAKEVCENYPEAYVEVCKEAVKKNGRALEFVAKEVLEKDLDKYVEVCKEAVKQNGEALEFVAKELIEKNSEKYVEICFEAVKNNGYALEYVAKKIINKYPKKYAEICFEAIKQDSHVLRYVEKEVRIANPEICFEAVKKDSHQLHNVPKELVDKYPEKYVEICFEAVKKSGFSLKDVAKELIEKDSKKYAEICIEAVKKNRYELQYVAKELIEKDSKEYAEICIEAVKQDGRLLQYVEKELIEKDPKEYAEICIEAVKQDGRLLQYVEKELIEKDPEKYAEICIEAVKQDRHVLRYVEKEVQIAYPDICIEVVKQDGQSLQWIEKEVQITNPEICIEVLKNNLNIYIEDYFYGRETKEVQEWMFEDIERIEKVKAKAEFHLSPNYNERYMDIYYHKMIKTIGYDAIERMIDISVISQEDIERYNLEYNEKIKELFEIKYKLRGEIGAVVDIFRIIDLGKYASKGKNVQFEVYKKINQMLEEGKISSVEELIKTAMIESGIEVTVEDERRIKGNKDIIVGRLAKERVEKTRGSLRSRTNAILGEGATQISKEVIERIIAEKVIEVIREGEGKCDVEKVKEKIREELGRTKENGDPFYSQVIREKEEKMIKIAKEYVEGESYLSKIIVEVLKEQKEKIGKGWIRKILGLPAELSKEEYDKLEKELGFKPEATYEAKLKDKEKEGEAYKELLEVGVEVITYEQIERMFGGMREPYSEKFKKFFNKHREEILKNPKIYLNLSKMHNNYDRVIEEKKIDEKKLTPKQLLRILEERKYENIKEGNEEFARKAADARLDQAEFEVAQEIYEKTKKEKEVQYHQ